MALTYQLTDKALTDQGSDLYQVSYTCTVYDEMSQEVLSDTVSGSANRQNVEWANIVANQIATAINVVMERAVQQLAMAAKTEGLADVIAAALGGE